MSRLQSNPVLIDVPRLEPHPLLIAVSGLLSPRMQHSDVLKLLLAGSRGVNHKSATSVTVGMYYYYYNYYYYYY